MINPKFEAIVFSATRYFTLLVVILLPACDLIKDEATSPPEPSAVEATATELISIQTTPVEAIEISDPIIATGTTAPLKTTNIKPMVSGLVEEVYVAVGDRVKKGQPLLKIRQTEIRLRIAELQHKVALARAELKNAKKDLNTNIGLTNSGVISEETRDDMQTKFDIARARLGIAETQLLEAKQNLADSESKSPFDGVVTVAGVEEGTYSSSMGVSMGSMGGRPSDSALQIQQIDIIVTLVRLPEMELSRIRVGTPAKVTIDGLGQTFDSQIHVINDLVDHESRTIDVRLGIKNDDYVIKPGLFARVEIYPKPRMALIAPRRSVLGSDPYYVFTNQRGYADKTEVTIREMDTQRVEITSGIEAGQHLLLGNNLSRLQDGSAIKVKEVNYVGR